MFQTFETLATKFGQTGDLSLRGRSRIMNNEYLAFEISKLRILRFRKE